MVALNVMRWGDPGAARTMVALHGITSNGGAMCEPARRLADKGWQVLAADMRGHGESGRGNGDFSFDTLLGDLAEVLPMSPDVLLGHSFGGTLAQIGVLNDIFTPGALILEDPVSVFADQETPRAMLEWDEANLPTTIDDLLAANPGWTALDAAWKLVSIQQVSFDDARAAFVGNAPWDLRPDAARLSSKLPTVWVLPDVSRFVPSGDVARLQADTPDGSLAIFNGAGHSVHRDETVAFVDIVERLAQGEWFNECG
ncbi:MAG: alpha/beta fold hydrolase [Alphaproteobacteria bacterium]|jgi:pimeloyl-ACP methyl ester carboxylesterase|tara:strand:+ start:1271 stop:2038 length:768 start_codon:yes stop_codon:yes gene_type:complete